MMCPWFPKLEREFPPSINERWLRFRRHKSFLFQRLKEEYEKNHPTFFKRISNWLKKNITP